MSKRLFVATAMQENQTLTAFFLIILIAVVSSGFDFHLKQMSRFTSLINNIYSSAESPPLFTLTMLRMRMGMAIQRVLTDS